MTFRHVPVFFDGFQNLFQLIPHKHGDDSRRRFVSAESVVIAGGGDGSPEKTGVVIHGSDDGGEEDQKTSVLRRRLSRIQEVFAGVGHQGPVVVLAAAIDPFERLFMEQAGEAVAVRHLLQYLHGQLVMVRGDVADLKDRRHLVLGRRHLVVLGLRRNPQLPELRVQVVHEGGDFRLQHAEVMIFHLLALRRGGAQERAAAENQVFSLFVEILVDEEIFLLTAHGDVHPGDILISQKVENPES